MLDRIYIQSYAREIASKPEIQHALRAYIVTYDEAISARDRLRAQQKTEKPISSTGEKSPAATLKSTIHFQVMMQALSGESRIRKKG